MKTINYYIPAVIAVLISGCDLSGVTEGSDNNNIPNVRQTVNTADKSIVKSLGNKSNIHTSINLGNTAKDVYIVLTNYGDEHAKANIDYDTKDNNQYDITDEYYEPKNNALVTLHHKKDYIENLTKIAQESNFNLTENKKLFLEPQKSLHISETLCTLGNRYGDCISETKATIRKATKLIRTEYGAKELVIYVSDDSFSENGECEKENCVNQAMVDRLANRFLKSGLDNDIYDWVTNIYGEEWTDKANEVHSYYVTPNNKITILITDLYDDNSPDEGIIGYFSPKDNFISSMIPSSNDRLMLYVDSVMLGNMDKGEYWEKNIQSTLAHEFQHMINFYNQYVLKNVSTDTWLNEMLSEATQDLIATKLNCVGIRGVESFDGTAGFRNNSFGQFPAFNHRNSSSLTSWDDDHTNIGYDYGKVGSFGAFLLRNYGGAKVLHDIATSKYGDYRAVEDAVGQDFKTILRDWGIAVVLSDTLDFDSIYPTFNTGNFIENKYKNSTYQLGSINFYNYNPKPTFNKNVDVTSPHSNYYCQIGSNVSGTIDIDINLEGSIEATLIVK